jgi:hypothetical protein
MERRRSSIFWMTLLVSLLVGMIVSSLILENRNQLRRNNELIRENNTILHRVDSVLIIKNDTTHHENIR